MKKGVIKIYISICFLSATLTAMAQVAEHPRIYINNEAKADFLNTLETVSWKKSLVEKKKNNLEKYLKYVEEDPNWLVSRLQMNWNTKHDKVYLKAGDFSHSEGSAPVATVRYSGTRDWATDYKRPKLEDVTPYFDDPRGLYLERKETGKKEWIHPSKAGFAIEKLNEQIMNLAQDAAFLYWLTNDKKYADFAAPVFLTYMDGMYYRDAPIDLNKTTQQHISGLATFEVIHEGIVVSLVTAYDFLYAYFQENNTSLEHSVSVFQKWGDQIIEKGIPDNNWNLFQARFLTYIALVLESDSNYSNGKGQEYFLDHTFNTSTDRQLAIKESLLVYDHENGIWPESSSYSVHVITTLQRIFTLLDQATNKNEFLNYPIVEKAALASFQYLFPSGYTVGFGDANHKILPPENFELLVANYRKYNLEEKEALISGLLNQMIAEKLYKREANDFFELFFYVDELKQESTGNVSIKGLTSSTFYAPNVSMFNQRMGEGNDAVMVSTVASYGNHTHANGISIELFANNYVLGPDSGKGPSYWHPTFRNYYARMPAHNTVVVDGQSDYHNMRSYNPYVLDNAYPESGQAANFDKITFSKVSFVEPKTKSDQQRFTAIIKSNTSQKYILDVFRSKKQNAGKQKHEYIYHNLGQSLDLFNKKGSALKLSSTSDLSSDNGDLKAYDFFTKKFKTQTSNDVMGLFTLKSEKQPNNYMKLWIKGSENQTFYSLESPKSNALSKGTAPTEVLDKSLPTLILKRNEAAWDNPFAVVFNPYMDGDNNVIENVSYDSLENYPNTQVITVQQAHNITDKIVLNAFDGDVIEKGDFFQRGLLSIERYSEEKLDFMFLSGMIKYENKGWGIIAAGKPFTLSIEKTAIGFKFQTDQAITINMPFVKGTKPAELRLYKNGKLVTTRKGTTNRNRDDQLVFKLEKGYQNAEIIFDKN